MRPLIKATTMMISFVGIALTTPAYSQSIPFRTSIPFESRVGDVIMDAGTYRLADVAQNRRQTLCRRSSARSFALMIPGTVRAGYGPRLSHRNARDRSASRQYASRNRRARVASLDRTDGRR